MPHLMEGLDIRLYHPYGLDIFLFSSHISWCFLVFAMTTLGASTGTFVLSVNWGPPHLNFFLGILSLYLSFSAPLPEDLITIISFMRYLVFDLGETVLEKL